MTIVELISLHDLIMTMTPTSSYASSNPRHQYRNPQLQSVNQTTRIVWAEEEKHSIYKLMKIETLLELSHLAKNHKLSNYIVYHTNFLNEHNFSPIKYMSDSVTFLHYWPQELINGM